MPDRRAEAVVLALAAGAWLLATPALATGRACPRLATSNGAEAVDAGLYARVRDEGLNHSRVMDYAWGLTDGIGARLTGSPNLAKANAWSVEQLKVLGAADARVEDWGEFGAGWVQRRAWVGMTAPDTMGFVAQAAPWSASSHGPIRGEAATISPHTEADLAELHRKLAGKVVLLGALRDVPQPTRPLSERLTDIELDQGAAQAGIVKYYATRAAHLIDMAHSRLFRERLGRFLEAEHVRAVLLPTPDGANGGGTGDLGGDDSAEPARQPWLPGRGLAIPMAYVAIEDYGRAVRLLQRKVPVSIDLDIDTEVVDPHAHGFNVVADIPGTDPCLKDEVVIVGGHLDSWVGGTGAADDGAGAAIALEVMRIIQASGVRPRRTVRIVLYGGEEQGLLGSIAYVRRHLGFVPRADDEVQAAIPVETWRRPEGPLSKGPDYERLSAAYNVDAGGGRIRGVFSGGNPALAEIFRGWIAPLADLGVHSVIDLPDWPADQSVYGEIGLPGVMFVQDPLDYDSRAHHTNMDTFERLSPSDMAQAATVEAIFVINSAIRSSMLPRPGGAKPRGHAGPEPRRRAGSPC